jgi:hypothetical protein
VRLDIAKSEPCPERARLRVSSSPAEAVKSGIESAGGKATIYQVAETLPQSVLQLMKAPPKPEYSILAPNDMPKFDSVMFGERPMRAFL